jgi:hypothetical protein
LVKRFSDWCIFCNGVGRRNHRFTIKGVVQIIGEMWFLSLKWWIWEWDVIRKKKLRFNSKYADWASLILKSKMCNAPKSKDFEPQHDITSRKFHTIKLCFKSKIILKYFIIAFMLCTFKCEPIPKISHYVYANIPTSKKNEIWSASGPKHFA